MLRIARHVFSFKATADGSEQPYCVCAPEILPAPEKKLPVVFYLHDILPMPTPGDFVEEAFAVAERWLPVLRQQPPALLVQPFGRGNAGWLGLATSDLWDLWHQLRIRFPCDESSVSLLGIGAGATGALQLACWYPDRFSAVAAVGPWADDRLEHPLGVTRWPAWERPQRNAVVPYRMAGNLRNLPVHVEHPNWHHGFDGTASREHFTALSAECARRKIAVHTSDLDDALLPRRDAPAEMAPLFHWLTGHRAVASGGNVDFETYSLRSDRCRWVSIGRLGCQGKPASVRGYHREGRVRLTTRSVDAVSIHKCSAGELDVSVDGQRLSLTGRGNKKTSGWVRLERLSDRWRWNDNDVTPTPWPDEGYGAVVGDSRPIKSDRLGGPMRDVRWGSTLFVAGTLGDDVQNETARECAASLRSRWLTGEDSLNPHPGDRTMVADLAVVADIDVTDQQLDRNHVVVIGTPRTNLLLARYHALLACQWSAAQRAASGHDDRFTLGGRTYDDPADWAILLGINPDYRHRYLVVVTSNSSTQLRRIKTLQTAYLPDYLVARGNRVLDWGYFDIDWRPPRL